MSGRAATATLEPAAAARSARAARNGAPAALNPPLVVRVAGLTIPVVRPLGERSVELEPGLRLGPLELRAVTWPEAVTAEGPDAADGLRGVVSPGPEITAAAARPATEAPSPGSGPTVPEARASADALSLVAAIAAPFVSGSAVMGLRATGEPTGTLRVDGSIGLAGVGLADLRYRAGDWQSGGPLPIPSVAVEGDRLAVDLGAFPDAANVQLDGPGLLPAGDGRWSLALPADLLAALGEMAGAGPDAAAAGADPIALARERLAAAPSDRQPLGDPARQILESLLGVDLASIGVHVDPPANAAAAAIGAPGFTIGSDLYFAAGEYGVETQELAALLARAVTQAAEGLARIVELGSPMAHPAQERASVPSTPPTVSAAQAVPTARAGPEAIDAEVLASAELAATEPVAEPVAEPPLEGAPVPAEAEAPAGEVVAGAAAVAEAPAEEALGAVPIELIIPPAPTEPGPAQKERIGGVARGARSAARRAADLPNAQETADAARGAVTEPPAETAARAEKAVTDALGGRKEPSPEIVKLCDDITAAIESRRPLDEDAAKRSDTEKVAREAGATLNSGIKSDAERVEGSYGQMQNPPAGSPALHPTEVVPPPATVTPPEIGASGGAPDPVPPENLSLDADRDAANARIEESGITKPTAEAVQEPPFTTVREGRAELDALAETGPSQVAAQQQVAIDRSAQDMAALQLQAVEALNASRSATVGGVTGRQRKMTGSEEQQRAAISKEAQSIFNEAQTGVTAALAPLQANAMAQWDAGVADLSTKFRDHLARVKGLIDERHSGVGGWFVSGWDSLTGLPDEITREYTRAEKAFGVGICQLLLKISSDVNTVIAAVEALIESARERIDALFRDLPDGLKAWAATEQAKFHGQLAGLHEQAAAARTSFVTGVTEKAVAAVAEVQAEIEQLREEAKGLIGKIADAIEAFIDDPIRAIINGLLNLVGIPPPRFWALVDKIQQVIGDIADDPIGFVNNLVDAVRQGFQQFFDNFGTHVLQGFWEWLFSGLGSVGVQLPKDMSAGSLITFALQVMGITWPNIRKILVKYIGEENVALIEQAWQLVSLLIEKGPSGIVEMIKEKLAPETLLETILKAAIDYLIDAIVKQVVVRVIGLLNPAGAIAQAIELIYKVLKWIFQNAAKIFSLIETVVNAMADVIAGNLSAVANAVEKALAMLIPIVIDFLADWLGFGDLPIKIAEVIKSLQEQVLAVIDQIIGWLVEQAKALLAALGIGGDDDEDKKGAEDTELGKTVRFSAAGEAHAVSVQLSGTEAELLVASVPTPVQEKLAGWRDIAPSKFKKDQPKLKEVVGLLNTADGLASTATTEANQLAGEFAAEQAAATPDEHTTPSDDTLESEEVTLASTLRQLYKAFDEKPDLTLIFSNEIGACHPAAQGDVREGVKAIGESEPELDDWADVKSRLFTVKTRIAGSLAAPIHQATGGYSSDGEKLAVDALVAAVDESKDKAPLRAKNPNTQRAYLISQKRFLRVGADNAWTPSITAFQDSMLSGADPTSTLTAAFVAKWAANVEPDEALVEAVEAEGGIVPFLRKLAGGAVGEITIAAFEDLWKTEANKDFVKSRFRAVPKEGSHEWIPTNLIPKVVARAATAQDAERLYVWVDMQNEMRTDTAWVIFDPDYETQTLTPPSGPAKPALTGHVGAVGYRFLATDETRWLLAHQKAWHDRLRQAFDLETPPEVVEEMQAITEETIWEGTDIGSSFWPTYYVKVSRGGGPKTISELGEPQRLEYVKLINAFRAWKKKWA
jgi:hypothetical protein